MRLIKLFAVLTIVAFLSAGTAWADEADKDYQGKIKNFLTEHTLLYADRQGGNNAIYFGRFGTFDWYFPCQIETGNWTLSKDNVLHLEYDTVTFKPVTYRLTRDGDQVKLLNLADGSAVMSERQPENGLPVG
ncbi:MAG: hypothetical protein VW169_05350 [Rhodospirillaceae bacterium]|jgi:hypothetical protein